MGKGVLLKAISVASGCPIPPFVRLQGSDRMEMKTPKPWLTAEQQVAHLEVEGVRFEMADRFEAESYLKTNNNFFRINQFKKGFPRYCGGLHDGEYIHLDFAMLKNLAIIDYEFRQVLLLITMDVEHFAKIKLLSYLEKKGEDGYSIVADFLASRDRVGKDGATVTNPVKVEIDRAKEGCYTDAFVDGYPGYEFPVWVFVELIPFGVFNQFLFFVANKHDDKKLRSAFYRLQSVKSLRNACGHNNCVLDDLKSGEPKYQVGHEVKNALRAVGFSDPTLRTKMSNDRLQQISTVLYMHHRMASSGVIAAKGEQLRHITDRMYRNIDYYEKNDVVRSSFQYFKKLVDAWYPDAS